jgi:hypothetical protein
MGKGIVRIAGWKSCELEFFNFWVGFGNKAVGVIIKYIIFNIFDHMLGEAQQTFFTVKDISAREFIEAFAQYLKKNNLIERPAWADFVKTATSTILVI